MQNKEIQDFLIKEINIDNKSNVNLFINFLEIQNLDEELLQFITHFNNLKDNDNNFNQISNYLQLLDKLYLKSSTSNTNEERSIKEIVLKLLDSYLSQIKLVFSTTNSKLAVINLIKKTDDLSDPYINSKFWGRVRIFCYKWKNNIIKFE